MKISNNVSNTLTTMNLTSAQKIFSCVKQSSINYAVSYSYDLFGNSKIMSD